MAEDSPFSLDAVAQAVLNGIADAGVACDWDGIIRFWNRGAERIFGYSADDAAGESLDLIIPERLRERHWAGYRKMMQTGQSRYSSGDLLSVPAQRKDGAPLSVEFTIAALRHSDGRLSGLAAVMRDVTSRFEEMKALRRAASARS